MLHPQLNLPPIPNKIELREEQPYIWDPIRRKWLWLGPEEWVRQHLIHFLVHYKNYPVGLIKLEGGLQYNKKAKRTDICIYNQYGNVAVLIECKAASVEISNKTLGQLLQYQKIVKAEIFGMSNGLHHYFMKKNEAGVVEYLTDIPNYKISE